MPRKIRELEADLRAAGFVLNRSRGKGSHRYWEHPTARPVLSVVISGSGGADARPYQVQLVRTAIAQASDQSHSDGTARQPRRPE